MAHSWPSWLTLVALFSILTSAPFSRAFHQTSPILAWSTAPGASLKEFLIGQPQESGLGPPVAQLSLGSSAPSLCPSGPSSLLVFALSTRAQQSALQQGFLSPEVSRAYNSVPELSRVWVASRPTVPEARSLTALVAGWKTTCGGRVVVQELSAGDDIGQLRAALSYPPRIDCRWKLAERRANISMNFQTLASVFLQNMHNLVGPRLVIFTTTTMPALSGLQKRQLPSTLLTPQSPSSSRMPSSKTGVFWRYSFLSDYLIIGTLVILLLFIPPVLLGSYALSSIESPKGLKTKMIGQISEVKAS